MNVCEYCGERRAKKRFCDRSCSNAWQHANGVRRTFVNDKTTWEWWVAKYGEEEAVKRKEQHRQATSVAMEGENNPMYGRHDHVHGLRRMHKFRRGKTWEELLGNERASELRQQYSRSYAGEGNPAYGKVYARGGRSKIQGIYKGIRFKSSYELSWLVAVLSQGLSVLIPNSVKYVVNNKQRTYLPDFQVGNVVIEIKPSGLVQHPANLPKFEAIRKLCTLHGFEFRIVTEHDLKLLTLAQIIALTDVTWNKGAREYINEQV